MKKVFISGKITGEPPVYCAAKFIFKRDELLKPETDFSVAINPLEITGIHFGISHEDAMNLCLDELKTCTHIYMLKDWKDSKGAMMEHQFAIDNGIEVIYEGSESC